MVTQVSFGNFFNLNGKTVLGGAGGSGIDTQSLITTLTTAKSAPATQDQDQIKVNDAQSSALGTLQQLLDTFQSASDALRNPPGVGNAASNVFKFTTSSVTSNTAVAGSTYVSASTAPGASLQSYTISDITSLATAATQGTGTYTIGSADTSITSASPIAGTAHQFAPGTITFKGQPIQLNEGDSLNTIAAKFNAVSSTTGVSATVIQIDATHFQLTFAATQTGTSNNFNLSTATDLSGVLTGAGLTAPVAGTNAAFSVNGIPVTRQSNSVNDVINGVTFNLLQETPDSGTKINVAVQPDTTTVQNAIVNFVNAYNAIKTFDAQQTQLNSDGTYATTAVLANNQTFRSIINNVTQEVTSQVGGLATGQPSSLADVGITLTNQPASSTAPLVNNILNVDDGQLTSMLSSNFNGVANLFGFNLTSNNPNLTIFSHTNALAVSSFTLNIDPSTNTFTATYNQGSGPVTVNLTATALSGSSYSLAGQSGTALDGLQLVYASGSAATINVTTTQGIADQLYNSTNAALTDNTGTLAIELKSLQDSDTRLNTDIQSVNAQVAIYQQTLVQQFSALEQAVSNVNSLLSSLAANDSAKLEASNP